MTARSGTNASTIPMIRLARAGTRATASGAVFGRHTEATKGASTMAAGMIARAEVNPKRRKGPTTHSSLGSNAAQRGCRQQPDNHQCVRCDGDRQQVGGGPFGDEAECVPIGHKGHEHRPDSQAVGRQADCDERKNHSDARLSPRHPPADGIKDQQIPARAQMNRATPPTPTRQAGRPSQPERRVRRPGEPAERTKTAPAGAPDWGGPAR